MTVAYTINGEPIAYPATVIALRAKKMKAKGAPELLYKEGSPLLIPIDGDITAELQEQVGDQFEDGELIRIKLEPIDERGRVVEDVPAAYVQFSAPRTWRPRPTSEAVTAGPPGGTTDLAIVQEAMRLNAAMAQTAIAKLPAIMEAAARILAAADGAGLPARPPLALTDGARNGADEPTPPDEDRPRNATADMIHGISEVMKHSGPIANLAAKLLGGRVGTRNAAPPETANDDQTPKASAKDTAAPTAAVAPAAPPAGSSPPKPPPMDPIALMAHMEAVKALLTAEERAIAQAAAEEMSPEQVQHWVGTLSALSVEQAAAAIRAKIGGES